MTHLVAISVGPVQEFIAAARRTSDLFAGSQLLVTVVGAAAGTFTDAERVFPRFPASGGANKILAVVDDDPADRVAAARDAARGALQDAWSEARAGLRDRGQDHLVDWDRADAQVADFVELYGAWTPLTDYAASRTRVERLLAGRKALRDFAPLAGEQDGFPRSALDPSLASVVSPRWELQVPDALRGRHPLWLKSTEVLDAVSLLKRTRGPQLREGGAPVLNTRELAQRARQPGYRSPTPVGADPEAAEEPSYPYYAVLLADGDRMGRLLTVRATRTDHRTISRQLDDFAAEAASIVAERDGQPVYAGGDDVLALLPVTTVVDAASDLAESFVRLLPAGAGGDSNPTLSVGVAIVHYLEPLSLALRRARAAERDAKIDRDAISITVHTRGGAPVRTRQGWPAPALHRWLELSRAGELGRGVPYELRQLADEWPAGLGGDVLRLEVLRILRHKDDAAGQRSAAYPDTPHSTEADLAEVPLADAASLRRFADLLLVARFLSGPALAAADPQGSAA